MEEIFYSDDTEMVCRLISDNWELDPANKPLFYYDKCDEQGRNVMARQNQGASIYIYDLGKNMSRQSINYDSMRWSHRICIDIQNPVNRERHYELMNEVYRILMKYRRAGRYQLGGWDYFEISNEQYKSGYVAYYHATIEINLIREVKPLPDSGFGDGPIAPPSCRPDEDGMI